MAKKNEIIATQTLESIVPSVSEDDIRGRIYTIRGVQVMLDKDLAGLYGVETKYINRAVKRNPNRFPVDFVFQLTKEEWNVLRSQIETSRFQNGTLDDFGFQNGTLNKRRGSNLKYLPYVFTESGVGQLSAVLKSEVADYVSINIQRAFVAMRRYLAKNAGLLQRLENVELKQLETENWKKEVGERFEDILNRMDDGSLKHKLGVFFENQMFDAFVVVEELAKRCKRRLVLIDDYVDGEVLERLRLRAEGAAVDVYVQKIHQTSAMKQAFESYHRQYPNEHVELHTFNLSHDRWMIVDDEVYHFGASIKDLGKKWFEVSRITEYTADELIARLN